MIKLTYYLYILGVAMGISSIPLMTLSIALSEVIVVIGLFSLFASLCFSFVNSEGKDK